MHVQFPISLWLGSMCRSSRELDISYEICLSTAFLWIVVDARFSTITDMAIAMAGLSLMLTSLLWHGRCHGSSPPFTVASSLEQSIERLPSDVTHEQQGLRRPSDRCTLQRHHCSCAIVRRCHNPGFSLVRSHIGNFIHGLRHRPSLCDVCFYHFAHKSFTSPSHLRESRAEPTFKLIIWYFSHVCHSVIYWWPKHLLTSYVP